MGISSQSEDRLRQIRNKVSEISSLLKGAHNSSPSPINIQAMVSELASLESEKKDIEDQLEEEKRQELVQELKQLKADFKQARCEARRAAFREDNFPRISELMSVDSYNQAGLDKLDGLLHDDDVYCRKNGIEGSSLTNEQLDGYACRLLSKNTTGVLSENEVKLARTHEAVVKPYLRIIFGQDYTSEQVADIIKKNPQYIEDAEVFYKKANQERGKTDEAPLNKFHQYSKEDSVRQKSFMEERAKEYYPDGTKKTPDIYLKDEKSTQKDPAPSKSNDNSQKLKTLSEQHKEWYDGKYGQNTSVADASPVKPPLMAANQPQQELTGSSTGRFT